MTNGQAFFLKSCSYLQEKLEQTDVVLFLPKVAPQKVIDRGFQHERVVDGVVVHAFDAEPARLRTAGERLVHNVIRDEEVSLELLLSVEERSVRCGVFEAFIIRDTSNAPARHTIPGRRL